MILPVAMLFTVMMIFLAFYSYDRCVMEHSAYEAAMRGTSSHFRTAAEAETAARAAAAGLVEGSVTLTYHCGVDMPLVTWLGEYVSGIDMTLDISRSAKRLRPSRTVRDCRILNRLIAEK